MLAEEFIIKFFEYKGQYNKKHDYKKARWFHPSFTNSSYCGTQRRWHRPLDNNNVGTGITFSNEKELNDYTRKLIYFVIVESGLVEQSSVHTSFIHEYTKDDWVTLAKTLIWIENNSFLCKTLKTIIRKTLGRNEMFWSLDGYHVHYYFGRFKIQVDPNENEEEEEEEEEGENDAENTFIYEFRYTWHITSDTQASKQIKRKKYRDAQCRHTTIAEVRNLYVGLVGYLQDDNNIELRDGFIFLYKTLWNFHHKK